jgi:hypothetical protein
MGDNPKQAEHLSAEHERKVRMRAHEIWVGEEKPIGRELDHWLRAERELEIDPSDGILGDHDFGPE